MAGTVNHDYHILPPSIWPLIGSTSAVAMFAGLVFWMHDNAYGQLAFGAGLIGVLATMLFWWMDVRKEANSGDHTPVVQLHHRYGMILFIASEVMFFVAWFWAYFNASLFPPMVDAVQVAALTLGAVSDNVHADPFLPAAPSETHKTGLSSLFGLFRKPSLASA